MYELESFSLAYFWDLSDISCGLVDWLYLCQYCSVINLASEALKHRRISSNVYLAVRQKFCKHMVQECLWVRNLTLQY